MDLKILTIIDYELECYVVKDSAPSFWKEPENSATNWKHWRPQGDSNPCYRRERAMS